MGKSSILIVEDEPIIAADLHDRLEELGYAVAGPVATGEEALLLLDTHTERPNLILMDILLGGQMNGIEAARRIHEQYRLPVIFLSSNSDERTFLEAKASHPEAFLTKPFKGRDIKYAIELALSRPQTAAPKPMESDDTFILEDRMFVKVKDRMVRIYYEDILWVLADDYYCRIVTREREYLVTQTLKRLHEGLATQKCMLRVHRSYVINLKHVTEIGESFLYIGQQKIPFNKLGKDELMARLKKI